MSGNSLLSGVDLFGRVYRFHISGIPALIVILVGLGICAAIGFWAGTVARNKGKSFGGFFALGFVLGLCGIIPGLIAVIIAYAISPEPGYGTGAVPPPMPGAPTYQPPPAPGVPPVPPVAPPAAPQGQAVPSQQGGYEYTPTAPPPPAAPPPTPWQEPPAGGQAPPPPPPQQ